MSSVGKTTAAKAVAKKFDLMVVGGGDMLKEMAYERGYEASGPDWWETKAGMKFLSERRRNPDFDKEVDRRLALYLKRGGIVITSYPMPWISKTGIKFWFQASRKTRAKRLAGRDGISVSKAMSILRKRDVENRQVYRNLYGIEFGDDLSPFHFVINTEEFTASEVASITCRLVSLYSKSSVIYGGK